MLVTRGGDVLYGLNYRPQEFDLYAAQARWQLRLGVVCDDPAAEASAFHKMLVIEALCDLPPDLAQGRAGGTLELARIGWQMELHANPPCSAEALPEDPEELPYLLSRVGAALESLASLAGVAAPLPPAMQEKLVADWRRRWGQRVGS